MYFPSKFMLILKKKLFLSAVSYQLVSTWNTNIITRRTLLWSQNTNAPQLTPNCWQDNNSPTKTALWSQPSRCRRSKSSNTRIHSITWQFSGTYNFYVLPRLSRGWPIYDLWVRSTTCNCGTDYSAHICVTRCVVGSISSYAIRAWRFVHKPMIWWSRPNIIKNVRGHSMTWWDVNISRWTREFSGKEGKFHNMTRERTAVGWYLFVLANSF